MNVEEDLVMVKHCKYRGCNEEIARKIRGIRDGHYNAVKYCPKHRELMKAQQKLQNQREARRTCRTTNQALKREGIAARQHEQVLEQTIAACEQKNALLQEEVALLRKENERLRRSIPGSGFGGFFKRKPVTNGA